MTSAATPTIDWNDVQGIVLSGYGKHPYSAHVFLQVDAAVAARAWITAIAARITTADRAAHRGEETQLNLAFTWSGLAKLGLSDTVLKSFPTAFFEGAASQNRSRILGDDDVSAPEKWDWGGPGREVDAMLMVYAKDAAGLSAALASETAALSGLSLRAEPLRTQVFADQREHFGFHDGISQPVILGSPPPRAKAAVTAPSAYQDANVIQAGEFLLGYLNEYGVLPDTPDLPAGSDPHGILPTLKAIDGHDVPDLGHNGTYVVARQMAQNVAKLWNYLDQATKDAAGNSCPVDREKLASKLIGRWPSGAPMVDNSKQDAPAQSNSNDFLYRGDVAGFNCPLGAHVRRANPRDILGTDSAESLKLTKRHRLIRRGRSYGPPRAADPLASGPQERGLLFMCVNANIERQFEFVQQTWINNPSFSGLYDEKDPVFGDTGSATDGTMTLPRHPVRRRLSGLGGFVSIRGAAYFFLPSIRALRYLGSSG